MRSRSERGVPSRDAKSHGARILCGVLALAAASSVIAAGAPAGVPSTALPETPAPTKATPLAPQPGRITTVTPAADPTRAYALYLPTTYRSGPLWPVVYAFDSRQQGAELAELFRPAAERFGWVVVSPLDSSNLAPPAENLATLRTLWTDSHERLTLDDRRAYGAAFSGMVRFLTSAAMAAPGTFAGVLGLNGGFPLGESPGEGAAAFPFFATVGDEDFSYYELMDLEGRLHAAKVAHRLEHFAGSHEWPPAELVTRGIGWLELQAMREGRRSRDAALVSALWEEDLQRAKALDAADHRVAAWRAWQSLRRDFAGLRDTAAAEQRVAQLAADAATQTAVRRHQQRLGQDRIYLERVPGVLRAAAAEGGKSVAEVLAALQVPELQHRARHDADAEERRSAGRVLYAVYIQAGLYLPRSYNEQGEHRRALFALDVAAALRPEVPNVPYRQAVTWALAGHKREALRALGRALELHWTDADAVREEPAFARWREDPELLALLLKMEKATPPPPPPPQPGSR